MSSQKFQFAIIFKQSYRERNDVTALLEEYKTYMKTELLMKLEEKAITREKDNTLVIITESRSECFEIRVNIQSFISETYNYYSLKLRKSEES